MSPMMAIIALFLSQKLAPDFSDLLSYKEIDKVNIIVCTGW